MSEEAVSEDRRRPTGVTQDAIEQIRELIVSGEWGPGTRLPREVDLARQLGLSRNSLREAVRALGGTRWDVIRTVVLPIGRSGVLAGVILGLARAIGETIAVTMVIGNAPKIGPSIFSPGFTLASVIANEFNEANQELHPEALMALGLILLVISVLVNGSAILIRQRFAGGVGRAA